MRYALPLLLAFASACSAQNKNTPIASTGVPAPMLYDTGDPITLAYPCDASHLGLPYYNLSTGSARPIWICNGTNWIQAQPAIVGTSAAIGGSLLVLNVAVTSTATVAGAVTGSNCALTRSDGTFDPVGVTTRCVVSATNTVTIQQYAGLVGITPASVTYNIRITL